ncbi:MAG: LPS assembly lipoprotein LptE [Hydrogenophaga sp.]|uniref:LPS-assembly lipoprotein LptE n=1 Tax=Hydrogenophaga sp. TaxID=1904254 RepID=UPI00271B4FA9|nr:LPS assembly lipoprotein LptE [Hydrogenophaga sp.]MDO9570254.1 LPS assembly lipoprotein LptE [Hydrogenophaga sp.]MDP3376517.1 LPS assembly lipoprotein LptE [Hydrogenophaga sp.]
MHGIRRVLSRRTVWLGVLAGACTAALSGCGFALRGAPKFAFESVRLQGSESTPVARELRRALAGAGLRVFTSETPMSPEGDNGQVVMTVLSDQREKTVVGQTAAGQVREMQLRTRFKFRLATATGKSLLDDTELLLERDISFTETAVLAKEAEEALLFRNMQSDIVQQVMRRLAAVEVL